MTSTAHDNLNNFYLETLDSVFEMSHSELKDELNRLNEKEKSGSLTFFEQQRQDIIISELSERANGENIIESLQKLNDSLNSDEKGAAGGSRNQSPDEKFERIERKNSKHISPQRLRNAEKAKSEPSFDYEEDEDDEEEDDHHSLKNFPISSKISELKEKKLKFPKSTGHFEIGTQSERISPAKKRSKASKLFKNNEDDEETEQTENDETSNDKSPSRLTNHQTEGVNQSVESYNSSPATLGNQSASKKPPQKKKKLSPYRDAVTSKIKSYIDDASFGIIQELTEPSKTGQFVIFGGAPRKKKKKKPPPPQNDEEKPFEKLPQTKRFQIIAKTLEKSRKNQEKPKKAPVSKKAAVSLKISVPDESKQQENDIARENSSSPIKIKSFNNPTESSKLSIVFDNFMKSGNSADGKKEYVIEYTKSALVARPSKGDSPRKANQIPNSSITDNKSNVNEEKQEKQIENFENNAVSKLFEQNNKSISKEQDSPHTNNASMLESPNSRTTISASTNFSALNSNVQTEFLEITPKNHENPKKFQEVVMVSKDVLFPEETNSETQASVIDQENPAIQEISEENQENLQMIRHENEKLEETTKIEVDIVSVEEKEVEPEISNVFEEENAPKEEDKKEIDLQQEEIVPIEIENQELVDKEIEIIQESVSQNQKLQKEDKKEQQTKLSMPEKVKKSKKTEQETEKNITFAKISLGSNNNNSGEKKNSNKQQINNQKPQEMKQDIKKPQETQEKNNRPKKLVQEKEKEKENMKTSSTRLYLGLKTNLDLLLSEFPFPEPVIDTVLKQFSNDHEKSSKFLKKMMINPSKLEEFMQNLQSSASTSKNSSLNSSLDLGIPDYSKYYTYFPQIFSNLFFNSFVHLPSLQKGKSAISASNNTQENAGIQESESDSSSESKNPEDLHEYALLKLKKSLEDWFSEIDPSNSSNSRFFFVDNQKEEVFSIVNKAASLFPDFSALNHSNIENPSPENSTNNFPPLWNLLWTWTHPKFETLSKAKILNWQFSNHFHNSKELTQKNLLIKHINKYKRGPDKKLSSLFGFIPDSFVIPAEYMNFLNEFTLQKTKQDQEKMKMKFNVELNLENENAKDEKGNLSNNVWIVKPVGFSRGRGIFLMNSIELCTRMSEFNSSCVVQKYIDNPLLIKGRKFDLRVYVLVTSFNPLEAFIYKEGFARFSTKQYSLTNESLKDKLIHLTNTAIQQQNTHNSNSNPEDFLTSNETKTTFAKLSQLIAAEYPNMNFFSEIWKKVKQIIVKTLFSVEDLINSSQNSSQIIGNSFEVFGFDVLLDKLGDPWLLEVNSSPSLEMHVPIDEIKLKLITDVFKVLNPLNFNRKLLLEIVSRRIEDKKRMKTRKQSANAMQRNLRTGLKHEDDQDVLNSDLNRILNGEYPRFYGEEPVKLKETQFEILAPSLFYSKLKKIV